MTRKRDKKKKEGEEKWEKWETLLAQLQLQGRRLPSPRVLRFRAVGPSREVAWYRCGWLFDFACRIPMNCRRHCHRGPR